MSHIIVIGGGAAGMTAAIAAARRGHSVTLCEKNDKLGKKLYITGKGRCNLTNACDVEELFHNVVSNPKFLYSSFYHFTNEDTIAFFEQLGLRTKIERGERVFPSSDKSSDVIKALEQELNRCHVKILFRTTAKTLVIEHKICRGIIIKDGKTGQERVLKGDGVIVATGGLSYPSTGSTGDGYQFAKKAGHTLTDLRPSLVPLEVKEPFVKNLQGLSLKNIQITVCLGKRQVFQEFGELLFTHFGVSGPVILSASSYLGPFSKIKEMILSIDLKPALSAEQLDSRILRDFEDYRNKQFCNALDQLVPKKLIPVIISLSGIDPHKKVNMITRQERAGLVSLIKGIHLHITGTRGYTEAVITKGGISVKEIDPSTMESKLVQALYFAGEVLDLDALTGGFNLQIAWSTGYTAGNAVV